MAKNSIDPDQLLQHGGALLALGRSLLDEHGGEDLVQDAYVAALRRQPEPRDGLGPWLATVVRNLASGQKLGAARRQRRERLVAKGEAIQSTADVAAETDLLRRLASAVHDLEEPYRVTVHLRYWQGLTPTQVAERLKVPRNTVRSRLQRGLEKLRQRMDSEMGSRRAWSLPLITMWKSANVAREIGMVSASMSGIGIIMSKWILGAAALMLVASTYWIVQGVGPAASGPREEAAAPVQAVELETPRTDSANQATVAQRQAVIPEPRAVSNLVTISGRCIDANSGQPLAGCTIAVRGLTKVSGRHELDSEFDAPAPVQSSSDGHFEIWFHPGSERIEVTVDAPAITSMSGWWDSLAAGRSVDVGDIPLLVGCMVSGQVVDTAGVPQIGVKITLIRNWGDSINNADGIEPISLVWSLSGPDGRFQIDQRLSADTWQIGVASPKVKFEDKDLEIDSDQATAFLEIVTARELDEIHGIVLDEVGTAVANARVTPIPQRRFLPRSTLSDANGRFRLIRHEGASDDPVQVQVEAKHMDTGLSEETYAWGSDDLQIIMQRAKSVSIQVVDADSGMEITDYAVRLAPDPNGSNSGASYNWNRRGGGYHENGSYSFSIKRGEYVLIVEPEDDSWATSDAIRIQVADQDVSAQRVGLAMRVHRQLQVVDIEGQAIIATKVQLVEAMGDDPVTLMSKVKSEDNLLDALRYRNTARLIQEGETDGSGEILLGGPAGKKFTLRLLGPGHAPKLLRDVVLGDDQDTLVVTVGGYATLIGMIEPEDWIAKLYAREKKGQQRNVPAFIRERTPSTLPQVWLSDLEGSERHPPEGTVEVAEDGSFRIDDVPAGNWQLKLKHALAAGGIGWSRTRSQTLMTVADLRIGEVREIVADASQLQTGTIRAQVFLDGTPVAMQSIQLKRRADNDADRDVIIKKVKSDGTGHVEAELPPGQYLASVEVTGKDSTKKMRIFGTFSAQLVPGQTLDHVFNLQRVRLQVGIVDAEGLPVIGRKFLILQERLLIGTGPTNEEGVLLFDPLPVSGPFQLATWPDELREQKDQMAYIKAHPFPEWMDALIRLGPVYVPSQRKSHEVELILERQ